MESDEKTVNHQKRKPTLNEGNRQSTINIHRQSSTITSQYNNLLTYCRHQQCQQSRWPTKYQTTIRRSTTIRNQKQYTPKADGKLIPKSKGKGCRTYLLPQSNFVVATVESRRSRSAKAAAPYIGTASVSRNDAHANRRYRNWGRLLGTIHFGPYTSTMK